MRGKNWPQIEQIMYRKLVDHVWPIISRMLVGRFYETMPEKKGSTVYVTTFEEGIIRLSNQTSS